MAYMRNGKADSQVAPQQRDDRLETPPDPITFKGSFIKMSEDRRQKRDTIYRHQSSMDYGNPSEFTAEAPICILKVELDGENIQQLKVYKNDNPSHVVNSFAKKFNLSDKASQRLLDQIHFELTLQ